MRGGGRKHILSLKGAKDVGVVELPARVNKVINLSICWPFTGFHCHSSRQRVIFSRWTSRMDISLLDYHTECSRSVCTLNTCWPFTGFHCHSSRHILQMVQQDGWNSSRGGRGQNCLCLCFDLLIGQKFFKFKL